MTYIYINDKILINNQNNRENTLELSAYCCKII